MKQRRGFTLVELMVVLGLIAFVMTLGLPLCRDAYRRARFNAFSGQLMAHLAMARQVAQSQETSVRMVLASPPDRTYRLEREERGDWQVLSSGVLPAGVDLKLPLVPLPHPTQERALQAAIKSSQGRRVIFSGDGSSSATLVYSDGGQRAVCVVVSGSSGRSRVFERKGAQWVRCL